LCSLRVEFDEVTVFRDTVAVVVVFTEVEVVTRFKGTAEVEGTAVAVFLLRDITGSSLRRDVGDILWRRTASVSKGISLNSSSKSMFSISS